ncbi:MAG: chorismate-binding protein, partial [Oscillospiraceae bacterium]|nr:chorismate-binding protein [Oscillospiraceae bacterium]
MYEMALYEKYPPLHKIFSLVQREADTAFLDSSLQNTLGRYSIIGRKPYLKLVCGHNFTVNGIPCDTPFPEYVKAYLQTHREKNPFPELPLLSGAIGYFSYDYGRGSAGVATRHKKDSAIPEAVLVFYDQFLIEDREKQCLYLISHDHGQSCTAGLMELKALVHEAEQTAMEQSVKGEAAVEADFTQEEYLDAVERVISYIVDGDIYIANLTQQLQLQSRAAPYDVYCCLRENNPSPFGGYLQYGDFQVLSMSPERFLTMRDRVVETRPIKGTRKRGMTREEDDALRRELADSEKDKSELLMIVDLERNDLHRVCVPGSVTVQE